MIILNDNKEYYGKILELYLESDINSYRPHDLYRVLWYNTNKTGIICHKDISIKLKNNKKE